MTRTNAFSILCVLVRAFALWIASWVVIGSPGLLLALRQYSGDHATMAALVAAIPLVVAGLMWLFADKFARLALARPQQQVFESDLPASEWQAIAFAVIGAYQGLSGLVGMSRYLAAAVAYNSSTQYAGTSGFAGALGAPFVAETVRVLLGVGLVFGARGLAGAVRRFRETGLPPASDAPRGEDAASTETATSE